MSEYRMGGVSMNRERIAEGLTAGREATRSGRLNDKSDGLPEVPSGCEASQRLIAVVPASRTTALKSAPTYP